VRPGERRILKALRKGPLTFSELGEKAEIRNPTLRSRYLKNLQKSGLVGRDIDSRKYYMVAKGWRMLYLSDVAGFIEEALWRSAQKDFDEAGVAFWQLTFLISEDTELTKTLEEFLMDDSKEAAEARLWLSKTMHLIDRFCLKRALEGLSEEEARVVKAYRLKLEEAAWMIFGPSKEERERTRELMRVIVEHRLRERYPNSKISEEMIEKETDEELEALKGDQKLILSTVYDRVEKLRNDFFRLKEVPSELVEIMRYLDQNEKVYKKYLDRVRSIPKALLVFPSMGFKGYLKRFWEFFPEKEAEFRPAHPWLHRRMTASW